jgi:NTP pyrophosphatase (non-canonical NTP hydrolase)
VKENREALIYFVEMLKSGKMEYKNGQLWRLWEPRRNWLPQPKRAEKKANGYLMIRTVIKEKGKYYSVMAHRVIWAYFNGEIPEGMEINHKNGFKDDNRIENLELVTRRENLEHSKRTGLARYARGINSGHGKLSNDDVREIRKMLNAGMPQKDIAEKFGVRPNQISRIKTGARRADVLTEKIETFNDFQNLSKRTLNSSLNIDMQLINYTMGLFGEVGEVVDLIKKIVFHGHEVDRHKVKEELGDVLFYLAAICTVLEINMDDVATYNVEKLKLRYPLGFDPERSKNREV